MKKIDITKQEKNIQQVISTNTKKINEYSFINCLDLSISLMSYKKAENANEKILSNNKILAMGAEILNESIYKNTDLIINESELSIDDTEELINQIVELPENIITEAVVENNIAPNITTTYKNVQINNQSDYELTEDMLIPNAEITNKKDIFIYHTHTCESYTQSVRI
ncbi:MAG: stage II sporulation protein P [Clostridia bacterium]|nr:stage II sporulation protein P [Clostridia bacterium]